MAAGDENIERSVQSFGEKAEAGELQDFTGAQNQIMAIQAEQRSNLQSEKIMAQQVDQTNQLMGQAGAIMSDSTAASQVANMNAPTQATLGRYGLKPGTQRSQSKQVTPQNIVINNNTTTTNVVGETGGPTQGRAIQFKAPNEGQAKFKTWLSNIFASQAEQSRKREKDFQKREWSLARSSNKMMKHLEDVTKSVGARLDPSKVGSTMGNQMKTLLFLFGATFLAKNFKKVIEYISKITNYFGVLQNKEVKGQSQFVKDVVKAVGGKEGESAGEAIKGFFGEVMERFGDRIENMFKERADAVKALKAPDLASFKGKDYTSIIGAIGGYLGDILKCLVGGTDGIKDNISKTVATQGNKEMSILGASDYGINMSAMVSETGKFSGTDLAGNEMENTSRGEATAVVGKNYLDEHDINTKGVLTGTGAGIKQSNALHSIINNVNTNKVYPAAVMTGLGNLERTSKSTGGVVVSKDFLQNLQGLGVDPEKVTGKISKRYYLVRRTKTSAEKWDREGAGSFMQGFTTSAAERMGVNGAKHLTGADGPISNAVDAYATGNGVEAAVTAGAGALLGAKALAAAGTAIAPGLGTAIGGAVGFVGGGLVGLALDWWNDPVYQGIKGGTGAAINNAMAQDGTLRLIPEEKLEDTDVAVKVRGQNTFDYTILTPEGINQIKAQLAQKTGNADFSFDGADQASIAQMESLLKDVKKKNYEKEIDAVSKSDQSYGYKEIKTRLIKRESDNIKSTLDSEEMYGRLNEAEAAKIKRDAEFEAKWSGGRVDQATVNAANLFHKAKMYATTMWPNLGGFSMDDMLKSNKHPNIPNVPGEDEKKNLELVLGKVVNPAKLALKEIDPNLNLSITSGYRGAELNKAVGGAADSLHIKGQAVDLTTGSKEGNKKLFDLLRTQGDYDQIINEDDYSWIHISYKGAGNRKLLTAATKVNGEFRYSHLNNDTNNLEIQNEDNDASVDQVLAVQGDNGSTTKDIQTTPTVTQDALSNNLTSPTDYFGTSEWTVTTPTYSPYATPGYTSTTAQKQSNSSTISDQITPTGATEIDYLKSIAATSAATPTAIRALALGLDTLVSGTNTAKGITTTT